ncbi:MAG: hypothetical protein QM791_07825 [Ferruginibacter sp.]
MDILHTFEVYQKQLDNLRKNNCHGRPQVLRQFRLQFKGFSDNDISLLKSFLFDNDKKWFVAHLLDNLDTFPVDLLKPMLQAAVNEPDPSFSNDFVKPCRRVFDYVEVLNILLDRFRGGDKDEMIGVLKVLYWVRPTVYSRTVHEGDKIYHQQGYDTFFWDYELKSFNGDFKVDQNVFEQEHPRQVTIYKEQLEAILDEFYKTTDIDLKYQIALRMPKELKDYPDELQAKAKAFLHDKEKQGILSNMSGLDKVQNIDNSFLRRLF